MRHMCLLLLGLLSLEGVHGECPVGFGSMNGGCFDINECEEEPSLCGDNAKCFNTEGNYYCLCNEGYETNKKRVNFTQETGESCRDKNECQEDRDVCGPNTECMNAIGSFSCTCSPGFVSSNGSEIFKANQGIHCTDRDECEYEKCGEHAKCINFPGNYSCVCDPGFRQTLGKMHFYENEGPCEDVDECQRNSDICGPNAECINTIGSYNCSCKAGFVPVMTDERFKPSKGLLCVEVKCDQFRNEKNSDQTMTEIQTFLRNSCSNLTGLASLEEGRETADHRLGMDGESLLERLMAIVERFLSGGPLDDKKKVTALLTLVENGVKMIGPFLKGRQTRISNSQTEVKVWMEKGMSPPQGNLVASAHHAQLNTTWKTATGDIYPGFTTAALICYHGLENSIPTRYFHEVQEKTDKKFHMNSKVVTVAVSNQNTSNLKEDIILTFKHLQQKPEKYEHICVYWDPDKDGGAWSDRGCETVSSTVNHTVCSCSHLSSFAVLMASFDGKDPFELQVFTWVGLVLSLICLILSIITFSTIRSIKSTRTTIHLHLCICLFIADLIFLAGISPTGNKVGCSVVAGLLHFFFLAAFCWMCLEGVQLFRMVVLVFHTTLRPLYMMLAGYGVPAIIVIISAISNSKGYGTDHHCWLSMEAGFIWSFFGPVCIIIAANTFFFLVTVWKLAQKFSSLNPDLNALRKIRTFTITAIAQLCVLGIMWIFGCLQFDSDTRAIAYIFTIFNTLQGVLIFIMHCLLSKQVREEYAKVLARFCSPQKKKYSEFSSNQSKSQVSKSVQHTGESEI